MAKVEAQGKVLAPASVRYSGTPLPQKLAQIA
jgi:hypothetical protein